MKKIFSLFAFLLPILLFGQTPTLRQVLKAGTTLTRLPTAKTATVSPTDTVIVFINGVWYSTTVSALSTSGSTPTITITGAGTTSVTSSGVGTPTPSYTVNPGQNTSIVAGANTTINSSTSGGVKTYTIITGGGGDGGVVVTKPTGVSTVYKPTANTDVARGNCLTLAASSMVSKDLLTASPGDYLVSGTIWILGKSKYEGNCARVYSTDNTLTIFSADSAHGNGWIFNDWVVEGSNSSAGSPTEIGLKIHEARKYQIDGCHFRYFKYRGIETSDDGYQDNRIDGQFTNLTIDSNRVGMYIGQYSEYNNWSNLNVVYNDTGMVVIGGNNRFLGGNIENNYRGLRLGPGGNNSHGIFQGTSFNHNTEDAVFADNITLGEQFVGCEFWSSNTASNFIEIKGVANISCTGGVINSPIKATGTLTTTSVFKDMRVPAVNSFTVSATAAQSAKINFSNIINNDGTTSQLCYTDISSTSTIVGITSFTYKLLSYTRNGSELIVNLNLYGTVSGTTLSFTIPNFNISANDNAGVGCGLRTYQSGDTPGYSITGGGWQAVNSGSDIVISLFKDCSYANVWNGSGSRACQGTFRILVQ